MAASTNVPDAPVVSPERVAAFRLSRHHLVERARASALARVAGDMAGTQAQVLSAAQMSLAARTRDISVEDVEHALWRDPTLVNTWCMRGALHLIPSKDFAVFVRGSRRDARSTAWMVRRGFPIDAVDRLVRGMRAVLDRPLTRTEIAEQVSASLGVKVLAKSGRGWGGRSNATGFRIAGTVLSRDGARLRPVDVHDGRRRPRDLGAPRGGAGAGQHRETGRVGASRRRARTEAREARIDGGPPFAEFRFVPLRCEGQEPPRRRGSLQARVPSTRVAFAGGPHRRPRCGCMVLQSEASAARDSRRGVPDASLGGSSGHPGRG